MFYLIEQVKVKLQKEEDKNFCLITSFNKEKSEWEQENMALQEKIITLNSDIISSNERIGQYKAQFNDFQSTLRDWEEKIKNSPTSETLHKYQLSLEALSKENSILQINLSDSHIQIELLNRKNQVLSGKLDETRTALKELANKLNSSQDEVLALTESKAELEFQLRDLSESSKKKDETIISLQLLLKQPQVPQLTDVATDNSLYHQSKNEVEMTKDHGAEPSILESEDNEDIFNSILSSPISKKTSLGLVDLEKISTEKKKYYDCSFTSPRREIESFNIEIKWLEKPSAGSSPMSQKVTGASAATNSCDQSSNISIKQLPNIPETQKIQPSQANFQSTSVPQACSNDKDTTLLHQNSISKADESDSSSKAAGTLFVQKEVDRLLTILSYKENEITRLMDENQYCREIAIESTLKVALFCQEYEANQLLLLHKNRSLLHCVKSVQSLAIRWMNSGFPAPHTFYNDLGTVLNQSHQSGSG